MTDRSTTTTTTPALAPVKLNAKAKRLLRRVRDHILAEPKRVNMNWFLVRGEALRESVEADAHIKVPSCGTVGCIAGWAATLDGAKRTDWWERRAYKALGLTLRTNVVGPSPPLDRLFYDYEWPDKFLRRLERTRPQTARHARVVADRIDYFLETGL